jgi:hypothetical protein
MKTFILGCVLRNRGANIDSRHSCNVLVEKSLTDLRKEGLGECFKQH